MTIVLYCPIDNDGVVAESNEVVDVFGDAKDEKEEAVDLEPGTSDGSKKAKKKKDRKRKSTCTFTPTYVDFVCTTYTLIFIVDVFRWYRGETFR